jgi:transglutaminase-like putative cysteine protease
MSVRQRTFIAGEVDIVEFTILHQTTYRYPGKIHESYSIVRLRPRSDSSQYCTKYELNVAPRARIFSYSDRFGNEVQHFAVLPDHDVLSIIARSSVITVRSANPQVPSPVTKEQLATDPNVRWLYDELRESQYVVFGPQLKAFATEVGDPGRDDLVAWYLHAGTSIKQSFTYDTEATSVQSTIDESIRARAGVCQDYAHVLVALCRYYGVPARYVSGYIFSGQEGSVLGAEASHAWCEAYLGPHGWIGYDPTNDTLIDDRFARIAVGRDYRDVSPVRGVYKGASRSSMSVNVAMEALAGTQAQQQQ